MPPMPVIPTPPPESATARPTAGSSGWFDCGFVTYSNDAKQALLGVSPMTLARHGAVSEQTTATMASGTLERAEAAVRGQPWTVASVQAAMEAEGLNR